MASTPIIVLVSQTIVTELTLNSFPDITHRDLKPDNILLQNDDEETLLKVSDFGLSKFVQKDSVLRTLCGTPLYVAPEVLLTGGRGSYTRKVDIWSLGVVLYTMLSGTLPFSDEYGSPATEQIKRGKFSFRHRSWKSVSPQAKKLIYEILTIDPNTRPSIDDILNSSWMRDPEVIRKAEKLMNVRLTGTKKASTSDIENNNDKIFVEPPKKRQRTKWLDSGERPPNEATANVDEEETPVRIQFRKWVKLKVRFR